MIEWIDQMAQERLNRRNNEKKIESEMHGIWMKLRDSLFRAANEYAEQYQSGSGQFDHVTTEQPNPTDDDFSVWVLDSRDLHFPRPPAKRQVTVKLLRDKHKISISRGDTIDFSVNQDQMVCLVLGGKEMTVDDATKAILAPILFPDLMSN